MWIKENYCEVYKKVTFSPESRNIPPGNGQGTSTFETNRAVYCSPIATATFAEKIVWLKSWHQKFWTPKIDFGTKIGKNGAI